MDLREPLGFSEADCTLSGALEVMGERWSFLILRGAFNRLLHFEEFQSELGIARNILSNRLGRLVDHGIMERHVVEEDRRKVQYRLTRKGLDLLPAMLALRQWGEKWVSGMPATPVLADKQDLQPIRPLTIQAHDGRILGPQDLCWVHAEQVQPLGGTGNNSATDEAMNISAGVPDHHKKAVSLRAP